MGLNQFDSSNYKFEYVPKRLTSLEACVIACHTVLSGQVSSLPLKIELGSSSLNQPDLSLFIDLAIDAGLVANRTLLNFLGLKLSSGNLVNESYALTIEKFSLPLTPVQDACKVLEPDVPAAEMKKIWVESLNTASKSSAHFTENGGVIRVARLGFACYATSKLVREHFFKATSTPEPLTILTSQVQPHFGGVWDAVDPQLNVFR